MAKKDSKKNQAPAIARIGIAAVVAATLDQTKGFAFVGIDEGAELVKEGLAETNAAVPNTPAGQIAARATQKGIDTVNASTAPTAPATDAAKPSFVIEDNVAIPAVTGRGRIASVYPFDKLAVGQSFFVAKPAKNLASTVSSANARYAVEVKDAAGNVLTRVNRKGATVPQTQQTRTFIVRSVEGGSRIWRKA